MKKSILLLILICLLVSGVSAVGTYVSWANNDGQLAQTATSEDWSVLVAGNGNAGTDNPTLPYLIYTTAHASTSGKYVRINRYAVNISKPTLGAGEGITAGSAVIRTKYYSKVTTLIGTNETALVIGNPANGADFVAGDFNELTLATASERSNRVDFTNQAAGSNINFTLNAAGITALTTGTGYITFYVLDADELDGSLSGTWAASAGRSVRIYGVSDATQANRPYLEYKTEITTDVSPPDAVSALSNATPLSSSIKFNWANPANSDFYRTNIYKDGTWLSNQSNTTTTTTFTGLTAS